MATTEPSIAGSYTQKAYAGQLAKSGPRDRLNSAIKALENAANVASKTADGLCGSTPVEVKEPTEDQSAALFPAILDMANEIERHAQSIIESMNRINRSVG